MMSRFRKLRGGIDALKASEWNALVDEVRRLSNLKVVTPLEMIKTSGATTLRMLPGLVGGGDWFLARLHDDGPGAPGNYTDQRYWVVERIITNTGEADTTDLTFADDPSDAARWVTATNLEEVLSESHLLPDNDNYPVVVFKDMDASPIPRYYFSSLGDLDDPAVPETPGVVPANASDDAEDGDTWDRENPAGGKDGVVLMLHTRTVFHDGADQELHGFFRSLTFDHMGRLTDVSAETEYLINDPDACP